MDVTIQRNKTGNGQSVVVSVFLKERPTYRHITLKRGARIPLAIDQINVQTFNAQLRNVLKSYQGKQIRACGPQTYPRHTT